MVVGVVVGVLGRDNYIIQCRYSFMRVQVGTPDRPGFRTRLLTRKACWRFDQRSES